MSGASYTSGVSTAKIEELLTEIRDQDRAAALELRDRLDRMIELLGGGRPPIVDRLKQPDRLKTT